MARQMGLGRGLAALLPEHPDTRPDAGGPPANGSSMSEFATALMDDLSTRESGLDVIYRALDMLAARFGLEDAALVLDDHHLGRQVFCAGRRPLDADDEMLLSMEPGVYTDPPLETDEVDVAMMSSLCRVALRLDMLRFDAWHDPLTSLYDRRSFDRVLEAAVAQSKRYHWAFLLVLLDLDGFKALNDREGHAAGDQALRTIADRFQRTLRFGDTVARIGGDEFALILPDSDPDVLPRLLARVFSDDIGVTASHGHAQCPTEADDVESLLRCADERLYQVKATRR